MASGDGFTNPTYSTPSDGKQLDELVEKLGDIVDTFRPNKGPPPISKEIVELLEVLESHLLKWVRGNTPCFIIEDYSFELSNYPLANYKGLYASLVKLLEHIETINDVAFNESVISCLTCVLPYLPTDLFLTVPVTLAELMYEMQRFEAMQYRVIDLLTQYVIPLIYSFMTRDPNDEMAEMNLNIPSILSTVLDSSKDRQPVWTKLMECLMRYKRNVSIDLLTVLAYGTRESLEASVHLLNRYFPAIDLTSVKAYQPAPSQAIKQFHCQSPVCKEKDPPMAAMKVCLDPAICAIHTKSTPPYYLCQDCYDNMHSNPSDLYLDVLQPVSLVSQVCDNEDCRAGFMKAIYFCFSLQCARNLNNNVPIRICKDCHERLHTDLAEPHMNHECLKELWSVPVPTQSYMVDAIVRLWSEAEPDYKVQCEQMGIEVDSLFTSESLDGTKYSKKIFRSLHGLWLLKTTCPIPPPNPNLDNLGRLFAMLLVWVESVAYALHPKVKPIIEQSVRQAIVWIKKVLDYDLDLYCSCLQPDPPMFARVGHPWNMLTTVVRKNLEILQRLVTLNKHQLIPEVVWDHIMPIWMQEIKNNTPVNEICKFKKILQNLFNIKSTSRPGYAINFITNSLESSRAKQNHEALAWVQLLSHLECELELEVLLESFIEMIITKKRTGSGSSIESAFPFPDLNMMKNITDLPGTNCRQGSGGLTAPLSGCTPSFFVINDDLSSAILVLDVLIKQLSIRKVSRGNSRVINIEGKENTSLCLLLVFLLEMSLVSEHGDHNSTADCQQCKLLTVFFYQVHTLITLSVKQKVTIDEAKTEYATSVLLRKSESWNSVCQSKISNEGVLSSITENETFGDESSSMSSSDAGSPSVNNDESNIVSHTHINVKVDEKRTSDDSAHFSRSTSNTSDGSKASSIISSLPELQLMQELLKHLPVQQAIQSENSSVIVYILGCVNVLCLRGECLRMVDFKDKELMHRLQTDMIIPNLWTLLKSSNSNLAMEVMPILLHCCCLEYGADILISKFEVDFTASDWKIRISAVEKVGLMCQFLTLYNLKHPQKQSVIVHAITFLVLAVEDIVITVAKKATCIIQSIKSTSLENIYTCLDDHFKEIPGDRLMLLHTYRRLHILIKKNSPLTREKFLEMFTAAKDVGVNRKISGIFDAPPLFPMKKKKLGAEFGPLAMHSRKIPIIKDQLNGSSIALKGAESVGAVLCNPVMYYRNMFSLYEGKAWLDGRKPGDEQKLLKIVPQVGKSIDTGSFIESHLDPVAEESEDEFKRLSSHKELTLDGEKGSMEDEVLTVLVYLLIEFLSSEPKPEGDIEQIRHEIELIIEYLQMAIGIGDKAGALGKEGLDKLRKSSLYVVFLMNLPRLLDGNKFYANLFLRIALDALEAGIKGIAANDIMKAKASLSRLDDSLQHAWLTSLIVILYKHSLQELSEKECVWKLMNIVKRTIDGHGQHKCHLTRANENLSMSALIGTLKMKGRLFKGRERTKGEDLPTVPHVRDRNKVVVDQIPTMPRPRDRTAVIEALHQSPEMIPLDNDLNETNFRDSNKERKISIATSEYSYVHEHYWESMEEHLLQAKFRECQLCQTILFQYKEDTINLTIIALLTFIHVDVEAAAPFIIDVIQSISRKSVIHDCYVIEKPTQQTAYIAQQALRCIFVQLAPKRLFPEIFREKDLDDAFFSSMATVLKDFKLLTQVCPIKLTLQDLEKTKDKDSLIPKFLENLASYMRQIKDVPNNPWNVVQEEFDDFFKLITCLIPNTSVDMDCLLEIMTMLLVNQKTIFKLSIDSIEEVMTHVIRNCTFSPKALHELCAAGADAFGKEENKKNHAKLSRKVCTLLTLLLQGKLCLPDHAVLSIMHLFCFDAGTSFNFLQGEDDIAVGKKDSVPQKDILKLMDCMDQNFANEVIDYLRTPCRRLKESSDNKNVLKASLVKLAVAQLLAAHIASIKSGRIHSKLMVLLDPPLDPQESPDVHEIVTHFRTFSWILLGGLNHSITMKIHLSDFNLFPLAKAAKIFEYIDGIIDILVKADRETVRKSKSEAQFHIIFLLAEIWTVYVERHAMTMRLNQTQEVNPLSVVKEFWSQLTPMLYLFLPHQKMQKETIDLFVKLIQGIRKQCPLTFSQLSPLWLPMLNVYANSSITTSYEEINTPFYVDSNGSNESSEEELAKWVDEMRSKLWNTEKMLRGKQPSLTV